MNTDGSGRSPGHKAHAQPPARPAQTRTHKPPAAAQQKSPAAPPHNPNLTQQHKQNVAQSKKPAGLPESRAAATRPGAPALQNCPPAPPPAHRTPQPHKPPPAHAGLGAKPPAVRPAHGLQQMPARAGSLQPKPAASQVKVAAVRPSPSAHTPRRAAAPPVHDRPEQRRVVQPKPAAPAQAGRYAPNPIGGIQHPSTPRASMSVTHARPPVRNGTVQRLVVAGGGFNPVAEDTFDGFLTTNNISDTLATFNGLNSLRARYLQLRTDSLQNVPHNHVTLTALNRRYNNLIRAGRAINANIKADAWEVGDVRENNRFELTLKWKGTLRGNKTIHCSFRHLLWCYLDAKYHGNPLNTIAYCDYAALKRGMVRFARHLKSAMEASADARTLTRHIANAYDAGNDLKFEADNGFNPDATEMHCYAIETAGKAATIDRNLFDHFTTVLDAYRTYTRTLREEVLASDAVQNAWFLIKDDRDIKAIFEAGGFWHDLDRLIATDDDYVRGLRLLD